MDNITIVKKTYKDLLTRAAKTKSEASVLYDLYKSKRDEYDSLRSQINEKLYQEDKS